MADTIRASLFVERGRLRELLAQEDTERAASIGLLLLTCLLEDRLEDWEWRALESAGLSVPDEICEGKGSR